MDRLNEYANRFDFTVLERESGILQVRFHRNGGTLVWDRQVHRELPELFALIASDYENRVVILTGTGDEFCVEVKPYEVQANNSVPRPGFSEPGIPADVWNVTYSEGKRLLLNLLDIDVPIIAAINGPAHVHSEILILSDIVLAAPNVTFQDRHMLATRERPSGMVAGDGGNVVWPMVLGPNRGRYFLMTSQVLTCQESLNLGVVNEIVAHDNLLGRAWELAGKLASIAPLVTRYSRVAITQNIKQRLLNDLGYGLALEGLAVSAGRGEWDQSTPVISEL